MSNAGQNTHQLQLDIQHELITANQLLNMISNELKLIKYNICTGGELELTVKKAATLMTTLAHLQRIDLENIPPISRNIDINQILINQRANQDNTIRNDSEMEDSEATLT